jgi:hypothetical protein
MYLRHSRSYDKAKGNYSAYIYIPVKIFLASRTYSVKRKANTGLKELIIEHFSWIWRRLTTERSVLVDPTCNPLVLRSVGTLNCHDRTQHHIDFIVYRYSCIVVCKLIGTKLKKKLEFFTFIYSKVSNTIFSHNYSKKSVPLLLKWLPGRIDSTSLEQMFFTPLS